MGLFAYFSNHAPIEAEIFIRKGQGYESTGIFLEQDIWTPPSKPKKCALQNPTIYIFLESGENFQQHLLIPFFDLKTFFFH